MNESQLEQLRIDSLRQIDLQAISNAVWVALCIPGLIMSGLQMMLIFLVQPLRTKQQVLVFVMAFDDFLKCLTFGSVAVQRLLSVHWRRSEVSTQYDCMVKLLGITFSDNYAYPVMVSLSVERMLAIVLPIWHRQYQTYVVITLVIASVAVAIAAAGLTFVGISSTTLQLVCTVAASPNRDYNRVKVQFENVCIGLVCAATLATAIALYLRFRKARNMKMSNRAFGRSIELTALKTLGAVTTVFLVSLLAATIYGNATAQLDSVNRAILGPISGSFRLIRGTLDCLLYLMLSHTYRGGLRYLWNKLTRGTGLVKPLPTRLMMGSSTQSGMRLPHDNETFVRSVRTISVVPVTVDS